MSLFPEADATLEVLRDQLVSAAVSHYIGKIATLCGMLLVCYDWRKVCCYPLRRRLILFPSNISWQRGTTTLHLKYWCSDNHTHLLDPYYLGMASQVWKIDVPEQCHEGRENILPQDSLHFCILSQVALLIHLANCFSGSPWNYYCTHWDGDMYGPSGSDIPWLILNSVLPW